MDEPNVMPDNNSALAVDAPCPLPLLPNLPNPYGSDLNAAKESTASEEDDSDVMMREEFSNSCDHEESEREGEANEANETSASGAQGSKARGSAKPNWLPNEYKRLRERLTVEMNQNSSHMPSCYERNSFYDGTDSTFLAARSTFQLDAGIFYQPLFFVWLPHVLVDRIPYPACLTARRVRNLGSVVHLQKHGFTDMARRVVDIDRNIYIVGYRYLCGHKDCKRVYQSWSPAILQVLPPALARAFEFRLTYRSGITQQLATLLRESFRSGIGPDQFTTMIESFHYRRFDCLQSQFLEMVLDRQQGTLSRYWTATNPFSDFRDLNGYAGFIPSAQYFGHFYDKLVEESARETQQMIAALPVDVLKQDHSFKVSYVLDIMGN
jgi:hypothetical protein